MTLVLLRSSRPTLVIQPDLIKARTKGAVASTVSGGKYGRIVRLATQAIWRLEAKHVPRLAEIFKYYTDNGIAYLYIPPGKTMARETIDEHVTAHKKKATTEQPKKIPDPPLPKEVVTELDSQRLHGPERDAVEVLRDRVATWRRPKDYQHAVDPKLKAELQQLISKRRSLSAQYGSLKHGKVYETPEMLKLKTEKPDGWKARYAELKEASEAATATFEEAGKRIRYIMGSSHATRGGGKHKITEGPAQVFEALPYQDLGFSPTDKPMSYLLSVGWHRREGENNKFSKQEFDALLFEYEGFIRRNVGQLLKKFDIPKEEGGWTATYRKQKAKAWVAEAQTLLYDLARKYRPQDTPSDASNFAYYVHTFLPKAILKTVREDIGQETGVKIFTSDLDSMPERGGRLLTPYTRIETPEQSLYNEELEASARLILGKLMKPLELAVVSARLGILNRQQDDTGTYVSRRKRGLSLDTGLRSFKKVKEDVIGNLGDFIHDEKERKKAAELLAAMSDKTFQTLYGKAMASVTANVSSLDATEKRTLAELAATKRLYLEGIRHRVWRESDPETYRDGGFIGKLTVKPEPVSDGEVTDLEKEHADLTNRIAGTTARKERQKLMDRRLKVSRKLAELRVRRKMTVTPEPRRVHLSPLISDKTVRQFWSKHADLATQLGLNLDLSTMQNVALPKSAEEHKVRAFEYVRILNDLRRHTPKKLQRMIADHASAPARSGKYKNVTVSQAQYQALMEHALAEKKKVAKSFVVTNVVDAWNALVGECQLWELNRL